MYVSIYQKAFNGLMEEVFAVKHGFTDDDRFLSNTASHTGIIDTYLGTNGTDNTTDNGGKLSLLSSEFSLVGNHVCWRACVRVTLKQMFMCYYK